MDLFHPSWGIFLVEESREEAINFEELRGEQEIAEYFDLVNSPPQSTSTINEDAHKQSSTTIQSTLDPMESLVLNNTIKESSQVFHWNPELHKLLDTAHTTLSLAKMGAYLSASEKFNVS